MNYSKLPSQTDILKKHLLASSIDKGCGIPAPGETLEGACVRYGFPPDILYYGNILSGMLDEISKEKAYTGENYIMKWKNDTPFDDLYIDVDYRRDFGDHWCVMRYDRNLSSHYNMGYKILMKLEVRGPMENVKKRILGKFRHLMCYAYDYKPFTDNSSKSIIANPFYNWGNVLMKTSQYTEDMRMLAYVMTLINPHDRSDVVKTNILDECRRNGITDCNDIDGIVSSVESTEGWKRISSVKDTIDALGEMDGERRKKTRRFFKEEKTGLTSIGSAYRYFRANFVAYCHETFTSLSEELTGIVCNDGRYQAQ